MNPVAIVSTPLHVLSVDLITKEVRVVESSCPEYYGISWFPDSPALVLSHSALDNEALTDLSAYALSEVGYLSIGDRRSTPFLSAPHQILCAPDGRVICTNTGRNAVTVMDPVRPGQFAEIRLSASRWDRFDPRHAPGDHVNSVFLNSGLLYVLTHGFSNGSRLAVLSYPRLKLLSVEPLKYMTGLHNIWVTAEGRRISCHSGAGSLVDCSSGETLWSADRPDYTRGLAVAPDFILVGGSGKAARCDRKTSPGGLWLVDKKTWRTLDYFSLEPYGCVHDVRLLNLLDEAHHGIVFAGAQPAAIWNPGHLPLRKDVSSGTGDGSWEGFRPVFGSASRSLGGTRTASADDLCLQLRLQPEDTAAQPLEFRYRLDGPPGEAHVSAVVYRGFGGDSNMDAFLVQRTDTESAGFQFWRHDGESWERLSAARTGELPLEGIIRLERLESGFRFSLNGNVLGSEPCDAVADHVFGIRFIGATVIPLPAAPDTNPPPGPAK